MNTTARIHLDHAAGRPLDPRVAAAMAAAAGLVASAEGLHAAAGDAAAVVEATRAAVAGLVGGAPGGVVLTAGATEARNLAVKGLVGAAPPAGHVVATAGEHPATIACCRTATRHGGDLTLTGLRPDGTCDPGEVASAVRDDTVLVCVHHGQAEVGAVQDVAAVARAVKARRPDALVLVDAGETAGLLPVHVDELGCDALVVSGTPMAAPSWTGALWVRPGVPLRPLIEGGLQEHGKRAGPHDLPGVAALGEACRLAAAQAPARREALTALTARLAERLAETPGVTLTGPPPHARLPGNVHVVVDGVEGETLTAVLAGRGLAVSPGSPCSAAGKGSAVLEAMGFAPPGSLSAILLTLDWRSTVSEVDAAATLVAEEAARLRPLSAV